MKKKITLIMALCIALCGLAGCSGGTPEAQTTTTAAETTTTAATEAETTTATTAETTTAAPAETEGTVLYEGSGVKITSTGFTTVEEYDGSKVLGLAFENTKVQSITGTRTHGTQTACSARIPTGAEMCSSRTKDLSERSRP